MICPPSYANIIFMQSLALHFSRSPTSASLARLSPRSSLTLSLYLPRAPTTPQSEEAAEAARAAIEYVELVIEVPQSKVGWIVGAKGANIRDIQEKSEVLSLNVGTQHTPTLF